MTIKFRTSIDPPEPGLAPVRIDFASAEPAPVGSVARADESIQHDAIILHQQHLSGSLIDDLLDAPSHLEPPAARWKHLGGSKQQSAVHASLIECAEDFLSRPHLDPFSWPKSQRRSLLPFLRLPVTRHDGLAQVTTKLRRNPRCAGLYRDAQETPDGDVSDGDLTNVVTGLPRP